MMRWTRLAVLQEREQVMRKAKSASPTQQPKPERSIEPERLEVALAAIQEVHIIIDSVLSLCDGMRADASGDDRAVTLPVAVVQAIASRTYRLNGTAMYAISDDA